MKKDVIFFLILLTFLAASSGVYAVAAFNDLHLSIQTTYSNGTIQTGTFPFVFNISSTQDCANVVYSNSTTLTTDARGFISYYLTNVSLDFSQQYWLCYYRSGVLSDVVELAKTPSSFYTSNVSLTGVAINTNLNLANYNITNANYGFFNFLGALLNRITTFFVQDINASGNVNVTGNVNASGNISGNYIFGNGQYLTGVSGGGGGMNGSGTFGYIPMWNSTSSLNNSNIYQNGTNIGIGMTTPQNPLNVNGTANVTGNLFIGAGADLATLRQVIQFNNGGYDNPAVNSNSNGEKLIFYNGSPNFKLAVGIDSLGREWFLSNSGTNGGFGWWTGSTPTQIMVLQGSGNLGINTSTPQNTLNVVGDINATNNLTASGNLSIGGLILAANGDATAPSIGFIGSSTTGLSNSGGSLNLFASGTRVGLMTSTYFQILVNGGLRLQQSSASTPSLNFNDGVANTGLFSPAVGMAAFSSNGTESLRIDNLGRVGIGTQSPQGTLHVNETNKAEGLVLEGNSIFGTNQTPAIALVDTFSTNVNSALSWVIDNKGTNFRIYQQPNISATGATPSIFINATNGNVGIGTTSPFSALHIANGTSGIVLGVNTSSGGYTALSIYLNQTSGGNSILQSVKSAGSLFGDLILNPSGGNVGIGTTTPQTPLHVYGTSSTGAGIRLQYSSTAGQQYGFIGSIDQPHLTENLFYNGGWYPIETSHPAEIIQTYGRGGYLLYLQTNSSPLVANQGVNFKVPFTISNAGTVSGDLTGSFVKARMYAGAAQTIPAGWTKLNIDTVSYNVGATMDATNHRIIPLKPGYYQMNGECDFTTSGTGGEDTLSTIRINGLEISRGARTYYTISGVTTALPVSDIWYFNGVSDYAEIWCYVNPGTGNIEVGSIVNYLSVVGPF